MNEPLHLAAELPASEILEASRSFEAFYDAESRTLFRRLWLVTGNRAEAEELMQDAFLKVWERVGPGRRDGRPRRLPLPDGDEPVPEAASTGCVGDPSGPDLGPLSHEHWEWSPTGARLVVARRAVEGDMLILIDPATGDRTYLGEAAGVITSVAWSPNGTRIAYGVVPAGGEEYAPAQGSVHSVDVGGGEHSLLASSVGLVSGGETGSGIRWSPDGTRIAVTTENEVGPNRLYLHERGRL